MDSPFSDGCLNSPSTYARSCSEALMEINQAVASVFKMVQSLQISIRDLANYCLISSEYNASITTNGTKIFRHYQKLLQ